MEENAGAVQIAQEVRESFEKRLVAEEIRDTNVIRVSVVKHCSRSPDVRAGIALDPDLSKRRSTDPEAVRGTASFESVPIYANFEFVLQRLARGQRARSSGDFDSLWGSRWEEQAGAPLRTAV